MLAVPSSQFSKSYSSASDKLVKLIKKQVCLLEKNLRHPSLRAKKYDEANGVWQARINRDWRLYFKIEGKYYILIDVIKHPK